MQSIRIDVYPSASEAPNWRRDFPAVKGAHVVACVVVANGTENGKPTVDLRLRAEDGTEMVALVTAALLEQVVAVARVAADRAAQGRAGG